jgi:hypothetical protein
MLPEKPPMDDSQFNIERATNGLVLTLYLAAAIFLAVILYYVLRDIDQRQPVQTDDAAVLQRTMPWSGSVSSDELHAAHCYTHPMA